MQDNNIKNWDDLNLKDNLLRGIYAYGFEKPSEIQKKAILPIINKNDLIAQAQSGTGKTGTFTIASLQSINENENSTQIIILSTTRELAIQTHKVIESISTFMENVKIKLLTGGTSVNNDISYLNNNNPHIVVGTPGRVFDMIKRKKLNLFTVKLFILDEADEMLSHGFKDQIKAIFEYFNENIQTSIFSATMPKEVIELTNKFMKTPIKIIVNSSELSLEGIKQYYIAARNDQDKYELLKTLYDSLNKSTSIIFVNGIGRVDSLYEAMMNDNYQVCKIHGSLNKDERMDILNDFKSGSKNVLISSDLTARGIDIQQISLVINFDIPKDIHTYLHRIGRSGRWGRKGTAINFICERDLNTMRRIENYYKISIEEYKI
jgi:translation initiation factor 4A